MKHFIFELRLYMKVKNDHRSKFQISAIGKKKPKKKIKASMGFEPVTSAIPDFFSRLLLSQLLKLEIYCHDHSQASLSLVLRLIQLRPSTFQQRP